MEGEKTCVFLPRTTRNSGERCSIDIRKIPESESKKYGFTNPVFSCFKHLQEKRRATSGCCFPCKKSGSCSGTLVSCPKRLYMVFASICGAEICGNNICNHHLSEADMNPIITENSNYVGPRKRKVRK